MRVHVDAPSACQKHAAAKQEDARAGRAMRTASGSAMKEEPQVSVRP